MTYNKKKKVPFSWKIWWTDLNHVTKLNVPNMEQTDIMRNGNVITYDHLCNTLAKKVSPESNDDAAREKFKLWNILLGTHQKMRAQQNVSYNEDYKND